MGPRVVIVTGASRGIGLAAARRFAAAGDVVGLIARDSASLDKAAADLAGRTAVAVADVSDAAAVTAAVESIEAQLGPCDVVVNNAGAGAWGAAIETDIDVFRRMIEVNYLGVVHVTTAVLPGMLARRRGRIVNVGSIAGRIGAPFEAAYSASKFAVVGYTEALVTELAGTGVSCALVQPGPVDTEFSARRGHRYDRSAPRPVSAERVADAIVKSARRGHGERYVPRWLGVAHAISTAVPPVARFGTRRRYAAERAALRDRVSTGAGPMRHREQQHE